MSRQTLPPEPKKGYNRQACIKCIVATSYQSFNCQVEVDMPHLEKVCNVFGHSQSFSKTVGSKLGIQVEATMSSGRTPRRSGTNLDNVDDCIMISPGQNFKPPAPCIELTLCTPVSLLSAVYCQDRANNKLNTSGYLVGKDRQSFYFKLSL